MSNRTLIEINHDCAGDIARLSDGAFPQALLDYLRSGSREDAETLRRYGIRVFGMRHHSEGFNITWGYHHASEKGPPLSSAIGRDAT